MDDEQPSLPAPPSTTDLTNLDSARLRYLENFLTAIFASSLAEDAFDQIIDGLPTRPSFQKKTGTRPWLPSILERNKPSEFSLDKFKEFRASFHISGLEIVSEVKLLQSK
jgi:hypothetical protein